MKNKKCIVRVLSCLMIGMMLMALSACGKTGAADNVSASNQQHSSNTAESGSKILIAYFTAAENSGVDAIASASYTKINGEAVGRLRAVADMIKDQTGGDLFSIQTSNIYPADGGELINQAADEQDKKFRPDLTSHIENPDDYDVIFVGFPKL